MDKIKIKIILVLIYIISIILLFSIPVYAEIQLNTREIRITTDTRDQIKPSIYENTIAWEDNRNGNWDIYMYDLLKENDPEIQIAADSGDQKESKIYKDNVVWQSNQNGNWDIYYRNIRYGGVKKLISASGDQEYPSIYEKKIVWQDKRRGVFGDVYMYDLANGDPQDSNSAGVKIAGEIYERTPSISKNRVVWMQLPPCVLKMVYYPFIGYQTEYECSKTDWDIYGTNLENSAEIEPISIENGQQVFPKIYDDKVVWVDTRNGNEDIYLKNLTTGIEVPIIKKDGSQIHPAIYENIVVWQDNSDGKIYAYDLSIDSDDNGIPNYLENPRPVPDPALIRVSDSNSVQQYPAIYRKTVVWQDNRNGNWDIYMKRLPADWTLIVYLNGHGTLLSGPYDFIPKLREVINEYSEKDNINIIILKANRATDNSNKRTGGDQPDELWVLSIDNNNRFTIQEDRMEIAGETLEGSSIIEKFIRVQGDVILDMADKRTLSNFIIFSQKNYSANKYALYIDSHGYAYRGLSDDPFEGIHKERTEEHTLPMRPWELKDALYQARQATPEKNPIDLIIFDACTMGNIETAYEIRNEAKYMVGSERLIGLGIDKNDLDILFNNMTNDSKPRDIAIHLANNVDENHARVRSAIDLSKIESLTNYVSKLVVDIQQLQDESYNKVSSAYGKTYKFPTPSKGTTDYGNFDLYDFCSQLERVFSAPSNSNELQVKSDASKVKREMDNSVVIAKNKAGVGDFILDRDANIGGLLVYRRNSHFWRYEEEYRHLSFDQITNWGHLFDKIKYLYISKLSPGDLLITDPMGRRTGMDYASEKIINEIPLSYYSGPNSEPEDIFIVNPINETYTLELIGNGSGIYHLDLDTNNAQEPELEIIDEEATYISPNLFTGTIEPGNIQKFLVHYSSDANTIKLMPYDKVPPVTNFVINPLEPSGLNGWYISNTSIEINASDDFSGVDYTEYSSDNLDWIKYKLPINLTMEGIFSIYVRSVDKAGNIEEIPAIINLKIDKTPPTTDVEIEGTNIANNKSFNSMINMTLNATDNLNGSGLKETIYTLDDNNWTLYNGSFQMKSIGTHSINFRSSDIAGNQELKKFVVIEIKSYPPILDYINDIVVNETSLVHLTPSASDPESDPLTFTFSPPLNSSGMWQTTYEDAGEYTVRVTVSDGFSNVSQDVNITVLNVNRPPMLSPIGTLNATAGSYFSYNVIASDPDNDQFTYSDDSPMFDINPFTGEIGFVPRENQSFNITVSDGTVSVSENASLEVRSTNSPPEIEFIFPKTVLAGSNFTLLVNASDPDGDRLTYSDDTGLFDINGTTGLIEFTPGSDQLGTYFVNITVSDGIETDYTVLNLVVRPEKPLELEPIQDIIVYVGDLVKIIAKATYV